MGMQKRSSGDVENGLYDRGKKETEKRDGKKMVRFKLEPACKRSTTDQNTQCDEVNIQNTILNFTDSQNDDNLWLMRVWKTNNFEFRNISFGGFGLAFFMISLLEFIIFSYLKIEIIIQRKFIFQKIYHLVNSVFDFEHFKKIMMYTSTIIIPSVYLIHKGECD